MCMLFFGELQECRSWVFHSNPHVQSCMWTCAIFIPLFCSLHFGQVACGLCDGLSLDQLLAPPKLDRTHPPPPFGCPLPRRNPLSPPSLATHSHPPPSPQACPPPQPHGGPLPPDHRPAGPGGAVRRHHGVRPPPAAGRLPAALAGAPRRQRLVWETTGTGVAYVPWHERFLPLFALPPAVCVLIWLFSFLAFAQFESVS